VIRPLSRKTPKELDPWTARFLVLFVARWVDAVCRSRLRRRPVSALLSVCSAARRDHVPTPTPASSEPSPASASARPEPPRRSPFDYPVRSTRMPLPRRRAWRSREEPGRHGARFLPAQGRRRHGRRLEDAAFMGLTSWPRSRRQGGRRRGDGDGRSGLFEDEVNPVMSTLLDNGVQVTALHNHFFFDVPNVYFMHIGGEGTVAVSAKASAWGSRRLPRFARRRRSRPRNRARRHCPRRATSTLRK